jgi:hypothetical protein
MEVRERALCATAERSASRAAAADTASKCRYCLGCAAASVEQTVVNLLLRIMLDLQSGVGEHLALQRSIAAVAAALGQGCDLMAAAFLTPAVQAAHADSDFPDLVQSELQRLLLALKMRCYTLATGATEDGARPAPAPRASMRPRQSIWSSYLCPLPVARAAPPPGPHACSLQPARCTHSR